MNPARLYTLMLGMLLIVVGIALFTPLKLVNDQAMDSSELNCSAPATDYDQSLCWWMQIQKFFYPSLIVFIGVSILVARRYII